MDTFFKIVPEVNGDELTDKSMEFTVDDTAKMVDLNTYINGELVEDNYLLPDKVYNALKWAAMLGLPALSTLVQTLGTIWGFATAEPIALTITALGVFIGAIIGVSAAKNYIGK